MSEKPSIEVPAPFRQPAYDAVYEVIRRYQPRSSGSFSQAVENARVWRAVEAALDAMGVPAGYAEPPRSHWWRRALGRIRGGR